MNATDGPVQQSIGAAIWVVRAALMAVFIGWACGNVHPVPPDSQAVVLFFGAVIRTQQAGLVLAWPAPLAHVVLLPGAERRNTLPFTEPGTQAAKLMTGDGGIVLLDGAIIWHITDAAAYYVMQAHVPAALHRLCRETAVTVAARHDLDDFLAVRPERASDPHSQAARAAIRGEIVDALNSNLDKLAASGAGLGVEILRADVTANLPADAKPAFDAVLEAAQHADQNVASARTDAARIRQQTDRDRDRIIANAEATSAEIVAQAREITATIVALETNHTLSRPALLADLYRERIGGVLRQADSVAAVDARGIEKVILP